MSIVLIYITTGNYLTRNIVRRQYVWGTVEPPRRRLDIQNGIWKKAKEDDKGAHSFALSWYLKKNGKEKKQSFSAFRHPERFA
jgi:hypothetical protein